MPSFEYDENKSKTNQQKHGIDFIEAQKLWKTPIYWKSLAKARPSHAI